MGVYVDGSALSRYLIDATSTGDWCAWVASREASFVTSIVALSEFRRAADPLAASDRIVTEGVSERLRVIRISDQALETAAARSDGLSPYQALHLGIAVSEPDVDTLATYDGPLARAAAGAGLTVVSPGRRNGWWQSA